MGRAVLGRGQQAVLTEAVLFCLPWLIITATEGALAFLCVALNNCSVPPPTPLLNLANGRRVLKMAKKAVCLSWVERAARRPSTHF